MSQDSTEFINTIEVEMTRCLEVDSNYSTQAMLQCVYSATDSWELELNKNYNELISQLDDDKKDYLKKTQQDWFVFQESETLLINELYLTKAGTMYILMAASKKLEIVKSRAIKLKEHLEILNIVD